MLTTLALVLAGAVAALLAYAATRPSDFVIQRSARIAAPPDRILPLLVDFHRWPQWSPWEKLDPQLQRTYSGAPSGVGAVYAWKGNDKIGTGRMEIRSATSQRVEIQLDFITPFEAHNTAVFTLAPTGGETEVHWAMSGRRPFVHKLLGVFLDFDKMVGKDFESGLAAMKRDAERAGS